MFCIDFIRFGHDNVSCWNKESTQNDNEAEGFEDVPKIKKEEQKEGDYHSCLKT